LPLLKFQPNICKDKLSNFRFLYTDTLKQWFHWRDKLVPQRESS